MKKETPSEKQRRLKDQAIYNEYHEEIAKGNKRTLVNDHICEKYGCSLGHIYTVLKRVENRLKNEVAL